MRRDTLKFLTILVGTVSAIVIGRGAMTLVKASSAPKPYDVAMYDVYSDLIEYPQNQFWAESLLNPQLNPVLIRVETESGQDRGAPLVPKQTKFKQAVDSAIADYVKRNTSVLKLQKRFNLPTYDLITKAEEEAVLKEGVSGSGCRVFQQKHGGYERWVYLSAVGFNQDQTVAVVYVAEWRGDGALCSRGMSGTAGYRMLQKRNGKWHLIENQLFTDAAMCYGLLP